MAHGPPFSLLASGATVAGATPAVELHSLGKIFPLGPLSTSLLAGDAEVVDAVREYSEFAWSPMSALQLRLGCACLEDDAHVAAVREAARARLARLHEALEALGFACFPTQGGLYQLCRAPASVGGHRVGGAAEAAELLLSRHHLAAVPFEAGGHGYLRFSGLYVERDVEALERLASSGPLVG
jgi:histidinol-phosphate/aromatic aminotransferase/cobyric acid decarboxylase-like protein